MRPFCRVAQQVFCRASCCGRLRGGGLGCLSSASQPAKLVRQQQSLHREGCTGAQEHPDTVGGAMLTGVREAVRALSLLRGDDARFGAAAADDVATGPLVKRRMVRVGARAVLMTLKPVFVVAGWCRPWACLTRGGGVGASLCASLQVCMLPAVGLSMSQSWRIGTTYGGGCCAERRLHVVAGTGGEGAAAA